MNKQEFKDILKSVAMLSVLIAGIAFLPDAFRASDCVDATRKIQFAERCIAHPDCTMSQRETQSYKAYVRLELHSCYQKEDD